MTDPLLAKRFSVSPPWPCQIFRDRLGVKHNVKLADIECLQTNGSYQSSELCLSCLVGPTGTVWLSDQLTYPQTPPIERLARGRGAKGPGATPAPAGQEGRLLANVAVGKCLLQFHDARVGELGAAERTPPR